MTAGTCSAIQPMVSGRPLISTTTVGVPVAWTASTSSCLAAGQVQRSARARLAAHRRRFAHGDDRHVRVLGEPDGLGDAVPRVALDLAALRIDDPREPPDSATLARMPARRVTTSSALPSPRQWPSGDSRSSASGPRTAIDRSPFLSGSTPPSFFRSTSERPATSRASGEVLSAQDDACARGSHQCKDGRTDPGGT